MSVIRTIHQKKQGQRKRKDMKNGCDPFSFEEEEARVLQRKRRKNIVDDDRKYSTGEVKVVWGKERRIRRRKSSILSAGRVPEKEEDETGCSGVEVKGEEGAVRGEKDMKREGRVKNEEEMDIGRNKVERRGEKHRDNEKEMLKCVALEDLTIGYRRKKEAQIIKPSENSSRSEKDLSPDAVPPMFTQPAPGVAPTGGREEALRTLQPDKAGPTQIRKRLVKRDGSSTGNTFAGWGDPHTATKTSGTPSSSPVIDLTKPSLAMTSVDRPHSSFCTQRKPPLPSNRLPIGDLRPPRPFAFPGHRRLGLFGPCRRNKLPSQRQQRTYRACESRVLVEDAISDADKNHVEGVSVISRRVILDDVQYAFDGIFPFGGGVGGSAVVAGCLEMLLRNVGRKGVRVGEELVKTIVRRIFRDGGRRLVHLSARADLALAVLALVCVREDGGTEFGKEEVEVLLRLVGDVRRKVGQVGKGPRERRRNGLVGKRRVAFLGGRIEKGTMRDVLLEVAERHCDGWEGWKGIDDDKIDDASGHSEVRMVTARFALEAIGCLVEDPKNRRVRSVLGTDSKSLSTLVGLFDSFVSRGAEDSSAECKIFSGEMSYIGLAGGVAHVLEFVLMMTVGRDAVVRDGRIFRGIQLVLSNFKELLDSIGKHELADNDDDVRDRCVDAVGDMAVCSVLKLCVNTIYRKANKSVQSSDVNPCIDKLHKTGAIETVHEILTHGNVGPYFDVRVLCLVLLAGCVESGSKQVRMLIASWFSTVFGLLELDGTQMDECVMRGYVCLLIGSICRFSPPCCETVQGQLGEGGLTRIAKIVKEFWVFHKDVVGSGRNMLDSADDTFGQIVTALVKKEVVEGIDKTMEGSTEVLVEDGG